MKSNVGEVAYELSPENTFKSEFKSQKISIITSIDFIFIHRLKAGPLLRKKNIFLLVFMDIGFSLKMQVLSEKKVVF